MSYLKYVNIKHGTKSSSRYSSGNTLPLVQLPFAMNGFTLQTNSNRNNWFYHPDDRSLEGIRLTHQPSPWIGDYTPLIMMPQRGEFFAETDTRWSGFRPEQTEMHPNYLKINILRYRSVFQLAPTARGGIARLTYEGDERASFSIFAEKGLSSFNVDVESNIVSGYTKYSSKQCSDNFSMYFVFVFDCPISAEDNFVLYKDGRKEKGNHVVDEGCGINIGLNSNDVNIRFATSFISTDQAMVNLKREVSDKSFEEVKLEAQLIWEEYLSRIEIECNKLKHYRLFYSCMYRAFLFPSKFYEIDKDGNAIHFCADTGKVSGGVKYVNSGFWDTFRTVYPLYSLIAVNEYEEIIEGYVNTYEDCGWLPKWPSPSEVGAMPGTLIDAVIAEAAVKGIGSKKIIGKAFEGVIKHATQEADDKRYGRTGVEQYNKHGYLPYDMYDESVSTSLDYAYGDYCIAQTAKSLGYDDLAKLYMKKSENYKLLFDSETGFMRGKNSNGHMREVFDEFAWGRDYCEGGPWQSSFAVYHDIKGLAKLYGNKEKFIEKLDRLFSTKPEYNCGGYKKEIHEMTEMAVMNFGQCAVSNQPSLHIPYIYAVLGDKEKTEYWINYILEAGFSSEDDGYSGDEDNGTMSAWVIFSMIGLYPFCPGRAEYIKIRPQVKRAVIHCENKDYTIDQDEYSEIFISHKAIVG